LRELTKQRVRPDLHAFRSVKRIIPHQQNLHKIVNSRSSGRDKV
jgi:hypothetical protein